MQVAEKLDQTARGSRGTQRVVVPDLPDDEQQALLRAVEHLRLAKRSISTELGRLPFALKNWVPEPHIAYELAFSYGGETDLFLSYTGRYEVGDSAAAN